MTHVDKKREERFCTDGRMMFLLRHFDAIITRTFYVFVVLIPPLKFLYLCKNVQWIQKLFELFCIIEFMYVGIFFNYLQEVAYSCKNAREGIHFFSFHVFFNEIEKNVNLLILRIFSYCKVFRKSFYFRNYFILLSYLFLLVFG